MFAASLRSASVSAPPDAVGATRQTRLPLDRLVLQSVNPMRDLRYDAVRSASGAPAPLSHAAVPKWFLHDTPVGARALFGAFADLCWTGQSEPFKHRVAVVRHRLLCHASLDERTPFRAALLADGALLGATYAAAYGAVFAVVMYQQLPFFLFHLAMWPLALPSAIGALLSSLPGATARPTDATPTAIAWWQNAQSAWQRQRDVWRTQAEHFAQWGGWLRLATWPFEWAHDQAVRLGAWLGTQRQATGRSAWADACMASVQRQCEAWAQIFDLVRNGPSRSLDDGPAAPQRLVDTCRHAAKKAGEAALWPVHAAFCLLGGAVGIAMGTAGLVCGFTVRAALVGVHSGWQRWRPPQSAPAFYEALDHGGLAHVLASRRYVAWRFFEHQWTLANVRLALAQRLPEASSPNDDDPSSTPEADAAWAMCQHHIASFFRPSQNTPLHAAATAYRNELSHTYGAPACGCSARTCAPGNARDGASGCRQHVPLAHQQAAWQNVLFPTGTRHNEVGPSPSTGAPPPARTIEQQANACLVALDAQSLWRGLLFLPTEQTQGSNELLIHQKMRCQLDEVAQMVRALRIELGALPEKSADVASAIGKKDQWMALCQSAERICFTNTQLLLEADTALML